MSGAQLVRCSVSGRRPLLRTQLLSTVRYIIFDAVSLMLARFLHVGVAADLQNDDMAAVPFPWAAEEFENTNPDALSV